MNSLNPWIGNIAFLIAFVASVVIRAPHETVRKKSKTTESRVGAFEKLLLFFVFLGILVVPVLSFTPLLAFANYPLHPAALAFGVVCMVLSLWLFRRSHQDLGRNFSPTLQIQEEHKLVSNGVYNSIRHPMYTSIFLMAAGQIFLLPNWIGGPALLVSFSIMFFSRLFTEEQMMLDKFGADYESYRARTKRIIPGIW